MLDPDLIRRVNAMTTSLSATVEVLLTPYVQSQEAKQPAAVEQWIAASNAMLEQFGAPGDEYSPF